MTIRYTVSEADWVGFQADYFRQSLKTRRNIVCLILIVTCMPLLLVLNFWTGGSAFDTPLIILAVVEVVFLLFALGMYAFAPAMMRNQLKTLQKKGPVRSLGPQEISLLDDHFEERNELSATSLYYNAVQKINVMPTAYYIFISAEQAYLVPYAAFADAAQQAQFLDILVQKTGLEPVVSGGKKK